MNQITEKTSVPLGWVLALLGTVAGSTMTGALWIGSVNNRLARIETKLGISIAEPSVLMPKFENANADEPNRLEAVTHGIKKHY